jgi:hypothetical protein
MRKALVLLLGLAVLAALAVPALGLGGGDGRKVIQANVLAPVVEPYTGPANPIRGVTGGGLPWEIDSGSANLRANGRLHVNVNGLVLARRAPVPAERQGTMPFTQLGAIVSCLTTPDGVSATTDNVSTELFSVTTRGYGHLDTSVALPSPCFAPIVFVTAPTGQWFAVTGR